MSVPVRVFKGKFTCWGVKTVVQYLLVGVIKGMFIFAERGLTSQCLMGCLVIEVVKVVFI